MIQDVDKWITELKAAGWARHATIGEIWISPDGGWYRGPYKAWEIMKNISRQLGVDIGSGEDVL